MELTICRDELFFAQEETRKIEQKLEAKDLQLKQLEADKAALQSQLENITQKSFQEKLVSQNDLKERDILRFMLDVRAGKYMQLSVEKQKLLAQIKDSMDEKARLEAELKDLMDKSSGSAKEHEKNMNALRQQLMDLQKNVSDASRSVDDSLAKEKAAAQRSLQDVKAAYEAKISVLAIQINDKDKTISALGPQKEKLEQQFQSALQERNAMDDRYKSEIKKLEEEIVGLKKVSADASKVLEESLARAKVSSERMAQRFKSEYGFKMASLVNQIKKQGALINGFDAEKQKIVQELNAVVKERNDLDVRYKAMVQSSLTAQEAFAKELAAVKTSLQGNISSLSEELSDVKASSKQVVAKTKVNMRAESDAIGAVLEATRFELANKIQLVKKLQQEKEDLQKAIEGQQQSYQDLERARRGTQNALDALEIEHQKVIQEFKSALTKKDAELAGKMKFLTQLENEKVKRQRELLQGLKVYRVRPKPIPLFGLLPTF